MEGEVLEILSTKISAETLEATRMNSLRYNKTSERKNVIELGLGKGGHIYLTYCTL
jgi:hypothetical protein